jgi:hypothetical protein
MLGYKRAFALANSRIGFKSTISSINTFKLVRSYSIPGIVLSSEDFNYNCKKVYEFLFIDFSLLKFNGSFVF